VTLVDYRHLALEPFDVVKRWLYSLDPKDAMLLSCDPEFKRFLDKKRNETQWDKMINWTKKWAS
jgi:hypothetical protein